MRLYWSGADVVHGSSFICLLKSVADRFHEFTGSGNPGLRLLVCNHHQAIVAFGPVFKAVSEQRKEFCGHFPA